MNGIRDDGIEKNIILIWNYLLAIETTLFFSFEMSDKNDISNTMAIIRLPSESHTESEMNRNKKKKTVHRFIFNERANDPT